MALSKDVYSKDDCGRLTIKDTNHKRRSKQNTYHVVQPNWHAKSYIEVEACLLLNQVMKGKNKQKKNKNQLLVL